MTREKLLEHICPTKNIDLCCSGVTKIDCIDCKNVMNTYLGEYDKHIIEQYKASTNLKDTIREIHDRVAQEMYCKGIDELVQKIKEHHYVLHILSDFMNCEDYGMFTVGIEQIAEELKAGVKDESKRIS